MTIKTAYDFGSEFITKIAALTIRDQTFVESTFGLICPSHFEDQYTAYLVKMALGYFEQYKCVPSTAALIELLRRAVSSRELRSDLVDGVKLRFKELLKADISDREFAIDEVANFARHQALGQAILRSADHLNASEYDLIEKEIRDALTVGATEIQEYDFFDEVDSRAHIRREQLAGNIRPTGITTGIAELDGKLYHNGFGREELTVYMGAAKSGKSYSLIHSALAAARVGYNVLYVTLENSREITTARMDAYLSDLLIDSLKYEADTVAERINTIKQSTTFGRLKMHAYPTGTWSPADCHRLIQHYKVKGLLFDELVVDYLDVMIPSYRTKDQPLEDSKNVWVAMRAIAQREKLALVTATQTNREGFNAGVADATHVATDIGKIRIADLVMSINRSDSDRKNNLARLYFVAGRNQQDAITITINQDLARGKFFNGEAVVSAT